MTTACFDSFELKGFGFMATLREIFKPEVALGSVVVVGVQLVIGGAWLLNDNTARNEQKDTIKTVSAQLEDIRLALPVISNKIEINGNRITTLEGQERAIETRIGQLEQFQALTHETLEDLKRNYQELVTSSQAASPVYRPKR